MERLLNKWMESKFRLPFIMVYLLLFIPVQHIYYQQRVTEYESAPTADIKVLEKIGAGYNTNVKYEIVSTGETLNSRNRTFWYLARVGDVYTLDREKPFYFGITNCSNDLLRCDKANGWEFAAVGLSMLLNLILAFIGFLAVMSLLIKDRTLKY